ncbi:endoglucanase [Plakobranchus ocellatus]|uniref:Endoglucanase n=1 Tax=Plakobranchus ocellatus TaxID=259542 RepID=A0AAV4CWH4_9GAST|nr:endoglucanase [Plakobranchus ocellatus]
MSSAVVLTLLVYAALAQAATDVPVDHYWDGTLQAYACINITTTLNGWTAHLLFDADVASIEVWDAVQTKVSNREFILTNQHYNANQQIGNTLCIYFRGHLVTKSDPAPAISVYIEGMGGPTSAPATPASTAPAVTTTLGPAAPGKRFRVEIVREWPGGFQGKACVTVYSHFDGWRGRLKFGKPGITDLENIWHATATKVTKRHYVLYNTNYNAQLSPGDLVCIGFVARCNCNTAPIARVFIEGNIKPKKTTLSPTSQSPSSQPPSTAPPSTPAPSTPAPSTSPPSTPAPSTPAPSTSPPSTPAPSTSPPSTPAPSTSPPSTPAPSTPAPSTPAPSTPNPSTPSPSNSPTTFSPVTETPVTVPVSNEWNGGFQADPCIDIYTDMTGWTAHLTFGSDIDTVEVWVATPSQITPRHFQLDDLNNDQLKAGDRLCFTFVARCSCTQAPDISIYIEGNIGGGGGGDGGGDGGNGGGDGGNGGGDGGDGDQGQGYATKNYSQALEMSILFYAAQRSGALPADNPIPWRGDSALGDCVTGGWYDVLLVIGLSFHLLSHLAGDHVKFGLPMASSTTLLTWSLIQFKEGYQKAGQLDQMYDSVRWPLDYFLAAWEESPPRLLVQVGDGHADHSYWGRAEEMTMQRPCQYVSAQRDGSDIAAETAAAMAAGSIAFKDKGEINYSSQLLNAAISLFEFAKDNRGVFTGASPFYSSSGDADELCAAAMFLYKATGEAAYLAHAQSFVNSGTPWALSWDNKFISCQILLYQETMQYKSAVQSFFRSWTQEGGMSYTPCGLAWRDTWGSTRYAANAAFAALVAADVGIDGAVNRKWAVEQINYILGDNRVNGKCFSFVVGYGDNYPLQPHHRGASCPDLPASCGQEQLSASSPNPQVLYGALVGGPDASGNYQDTRGDYIANEVATDYNSGFQGALAVRALTDELHLSRSKSCTESVANFCVQPHGATFNATAQFHMDNRRARVAFVMVMRRIFKKRKRQRRVWVLTDY